MPPISSSLPGMSGLAGMTPMGAGASLAANALESVKSSASSSATSTSSNDFGGSINVGAYQRDNTIMYVALAGIAAIVLVMVVKK